MALPAVYLFIRKHLSSDEKAESEYSKKFESLLEGVDAERYWARNFHIIFMFRRLYFSLLFAIQPQLYLLQLGLNLIHCIVVSSHYNNRF